MTYPSDELYRHVVGVMGMRRRYEDEAYLEFIRRKPCIRCIKPSPSDPHHLVSRGWREPNRNDYATVPVCRPCHNAWEAPGMDVAKWLEDRKIPAVYLAEMVSCYLAEFFTRKSQEAAPF